MSTCFAQTPLYINWCSGRWSSDPNFSKGLCSYEAELMLPCITASQVVVTMWLW